MAPLADWLSRSPSLVHALARKINETRFPHSLGTVTSRGWLSLSLSLILGGQWSLVSQGGNTCGGKITLLCFLLSHVTKERELEGGAAGRDV